MIHLFHYISFDYFYFRYILLLFHSGAVIDDHHLENHRRHLDNFRHWAQIGHRFAEIAAYVRSFFRRDHGRTPLFAGFRPTAAPVWPKSQMQWMTVLPDGWPMFV
jgi:hypothetical protein